MDYWVHAGDGVRAAPRVAPPVLGPRSQRAPLDALDRAYRAVLGALALAPGHRAELLARGLDEPEVERRGYRTLPSRGRAALARHVVDAVGEDVAAGVPGCALAEDGGRRWWTFAGAPGLLIPLRDMAGRVVALKCRRDAPEPGRRYVYVSSAHRGGASALSAVHVPCFDGARDEVRVTEGELKADVCTALSGVLTVSVPGVGSWAAVLPVLAEIGARRVRVAFDADHRWKPDVARSLAALVRALRGEQFGVTVESWDPARGKGLDDVLARERRGAVA